MLHFIEAVVPPRYPLAKKRWSQRVPISLVQRSSVYWFEIGLLHKRRVLSVLSQRARCKRGDVEVAARRDGTRHTSLSACAGQEEGRRGLTGAVWSTLRF